MQPNEQTQTTRVETTPTPRTITIPAFTLVVLVGPSGSGKSTFARQHFLSTEIVSSDTCRALVSDDETNQDATGDAFDLLRYMVRKRLERKRLTVVDATSVRPEDRAELVRLAREYHCLPTVIVLNMPPALCHERNAARANRDFGSHVVRNQHRALKRSLKQLRREGFRFRYVFDDPEALEGLTIERTKLWCDREELTGPFDIIGDVHGCFDELTALMRQLGYTIEETDDPIARYHVTPPEGRTLVFVGDLVDRGPRTPDVLRLVMGMVRAGTGLCVCGNHDAKLVRALDGRNVKLRHGLAESMEQLAAEPEAFRRAARDFLDGLISHYMLADGALCVAHAGLTESLQGRASGRVREFAMYGDTDGEIDAFGLPVRHDWAAEYRGKTEVVYGHTPTPEPVWINNTLCLDTGCVFGGKLTALRWPERELVSEDAAQVYAEPIRPIESEATPAPTDTHHPMDLDLSDVTGKRILHTRLIPKITIRAEYAAGALETMSRFAADPRWLIYLPPTTAPPRTSERPGLLEHPEDALAYYESQGVEEVVCEEKHMGSRAVLVVCKTPEVAVSRFGLDTPADGVILTRTGRRFFGADEETERALLLRVREAITRAGMWDALETEWLCLDAELMPWNAKAKALLRHQYAPVGVAARVGLGATVAALEQAEARGLEVASLLGSFRQRAEDARKYTDAYRAYCWTVDSTDDLRLAPFHLLAAEGAAFLDRPHTWHLEQLDRLVEADAANPAHERPLLQRTGRLFVRLDDPEARAQAIARWAALCADGGEGFVVKPTASILTHKHRLVLPAVKCRGPEYLRIIYGLHYDHPEHLVQLRKRGLGRKSTLARQEFALGVEALERFARGATLREVHACVFGILALESEPLDPRL